MSAQSSANAPRLPRAKRAQGTGSAGRSVSLRALATADWRRIRRTWLVPLTVMGPAGVTLLGVVLFWLRGEWILGDFDPALHSGLGIVVGQLGYVHVFALCLGATLLASMVVDVEHRSDTWKSMLALPVRRWKAYLTKYAWTAALLAASSLLMGLGYAAIMTWQDIGAVPWGDVVQLAALTWAGTMPLLAFQLLASTAIKNQAVPLALGIVTPMFGMGMRSMPGWLPWRLPSVALDAAAGRIADVAAPMSASGVVCAAVFGTALLLFAGSVALERREIV